MLLMLMFHVQNSFKCTLVNGLPMKQRYLQSFACHAIHSLWPAVAEGKTHDTGGFQGPDRTSHPPEQPLLSRHFPAS